MKTLLDYEKLIRRSVNCYEYTGPCSRCCAALTCAMKQIAVALLHGGGY